MTKIIINKENAELSIKISLAAEAALNVSNSYRKTFNDPLIVKWEDLTLLDREVILNITRDYYLSPNATIPEEMLCYTDLNDLFDENKNAKTTPFKDLSYERKTAMVLFQETVISISKMLEKLNPLEDSSSDESFIPGSLFNIIGKHLK